MKGQTNRLDGIIDVLKKAFIKHVVDLTKASKKVANISLGIVLIVLQNLIGVLSI